MRKAQKTYILNFINLLGQAHNKITKYIEKKDMINALQLLEQCQQDVLKLGNLIEKTTEGSEVISTLEEYCEMAYQAYEAIQQDEIKKINRIFRYLQRILIRAENNVKNDIPVKKEVIFLPYKASMWDSLESIWREADKDENCDAYVIPIPYYDKNPDGSFKEMHYEIEQFPEYVPIIDYKFYDFKEQHPDMIFIHNPYDEFNYVTSVLPFFYSKNLKKLTDCLVYVPYFILGEMEPDNIKAVKAIEHFCTVPGVINADKVIVQSENIRDVYISVLTEYAGKKTKEYWKSKIWGLGSPKIDKILNYRKNDFEIPDNWMRIIKKTDGKWKKIILYNTSVTGLLKHRDKMLNKIKEVFHIFYENKDQVVLLWRPHPLLKATIESMHPELWKKYEEILCEYCTVGWGIYDDSADLDRALIISDAYYGDQSSLVQLYRKTGKPIMIQNINI